MEVEDEPVVPQPLTAFPANERRAVTTVLCDIDDTLTTDGRLPGTSYSGLERLRDAGIRVVPVTGRPGGWCDLIARMWPVDGVIGENGAFYFRYDHATRRMIRHYSVDAEIRKRDRHKLTEIQAHILANVPGCGIAADQPYREADLAIDFAEDVPCLPDREVERIVAYFRAAGAHAKVSSIHVNGWFGDYDKLTTTRKFMQEVFRVDIEEPEENRRIVFVGDSPNDEPMFRFFSNSVGVANIRDFFERVVHRPTWITNERGGSGFVELAECLLETR